MSKAEVLVSPEPLVDTHCHLDYEYEGKSDADLIREAAHAGVNTLITIGTEIQRLENIARIADRNPNVFFTVGVHPHEAISIQDADLDTIRKFGRHPKCVAVGEIGLDFHYDHSPRDVQMRRFQDQLDIALELKKPVVIHAREAESELLEALSAFAPKAGSRKGVIHCFSGTRDFGDACLKLGFHLSFSGILTFKKAADLQAAARGWPLDRLLVETDSPYLAPEPYRGKKCEPYMVVRTAAKLAELQQTTLARVAAATTANAKTLFGIP
jgi:TatD DNase family protein